MNFSLFLVLLKLAGSPAFSQDTDQLDIANLTLEELLKVRITPFQLSLNKDFGYHASNSVTGSRIDTPIGELPFALQAFTQNFIEDQHPSNIFDIAKYSPGVTYRSNDFNEGNANLSIRGFTVGSAPGAGQILRDGLNGPSIFDFTNISRVEIVKGPASFLYGQLSPGGIVNIITKTPLRTFESNAKLTVGSYDSYRVQADVTGPVDDKWSYRFASSYDQDIHYWDAYDSHSINISPALLWQISKRVRMTFKYEAFIKRESPQLMQKPGYGSQVGVTPTESDPNKSGVDVPNLSDKWNSMSFADFRNSDTHSFDSILDYNIDKNWDLRANYSHVDYKIDALFSGNLGMPNNTTLLQGRRLRKQIYYNRGDIFQIEGIGKYNFENFSLKLFTGAQINTKLFNSEAGQAPNDPSLGTDPVATPLPRWDLGNPTTWDRIVNIPLSSLTDARSDNSTRSQDKSIYAGTNIGLLNDKLLVLTGIRKTITESEFRNNLNQTSLPEIKNERNTPQIGTLYKLNSAFSIFASYSESFVPSQETLRVQNVATVPAKPTEGQGYDAGIKVVDSRNNISGTLTYFEINNKNIINDLTSLDPTTGQQVFTNIQSGRQRSRGIELDLTMTPIQNWQLYFSYSYMDAKILEFSGRDNEILSQDPATLNAADKINYKNVLRFHRAPLAMSAPHLANLWTRYDFVQENKLKHFFVAGGFNLVRNQTLLPDTPRSAYQNYTLFNILLGRFLQIWEHSGKAELMIKNITNEHYRPSQSSRSRPREYLLTVALNI